MKEHDPVVLTNDIANTDLRAGDVGTVVHAYERCGRVTSCMRVP